MRDRSWEQTLMAVQALGYLGIAPRTSISGPTSRRANWGCSWWTGPLVVNNYGKLGPAFAETDLGEADLETTFTDLMSGQYRSRGHPTRLAWSRSTYFTST